MGMGGGGGPERARAAPPPHGESSVMRQSGDGDVEMETETDLTPRHSAKRRKTTVRTNPKSVDVSMSDPSRRASLTCHRLRVRRGSRAAAVYVRGDVVDLLAVFIRHGFAVRGPRIRAEHHSAFENDPADRGARFHRVFKVKPGAPEHVVAPHVVEVEPARVRVVAH